MKRRQFIKTATFAGTLAPVIKNLNSQNVKSAGSSDTDKVTDELYWKQIRESFNLQNTFINLENGYFSPQAQKTLEFHQQRELYINKHTSWYMRKQQNEALETSRKSLADFLGCDKEELAITRNTTEALNILIMGYPWEKGDEVVIGNQDYGSMVAAFTQVEQRFGVKVKVAQIPLLPKNDDEVIKSYTELFSKKTRLVHLTHLINLTGQVIPVQKIADQAREKGIEVAVDAAHSVAHLNFKIPDLHAHYVGASLHKWLCNTLGVGFLFVAAEKIVKLWPLMGDSDYPKNNIRKFEHQGTRPVQAIETIEEAIRFHNMIGGELKEKRLRYLMQYWVKKIENNSDISVNTPWKESDRCGAIANVAKNGISATELANHLMDNHKIFTVAIEHPAVKGIRVTPHIYTGIEELDALANALNS